MFDFADGDMAFVAKPQIPAGNVNWSSSGRWVHAAKVGFAKGLLSKIGSGTAEPVYEQLVPQVLGINTLKAIRVEEGA